MRCRVTVLRLWIPVMPRICWLKGSGWRRLEGSGLMKMLDMIVLDRRVVVICLRVILSTGAAAAVADTALYPRSIAKFGRA